MKVDTSDRCTGLDSLRAFAVVGVVALHVLGGINSLELSTGNELIVAILLGISYCAVNLFGLLSGYLKVDRPNHYSSLIKIILQTAFWCLVISVLCALFCGQNSLKHIIVNAFPFTGDRLWYITCYIFVFVCSPYLNLLVNTMTQKAHNKLLAILTILMSLLTIIVVKDVFHIVNNGYSVAWLMYLYLLGAYVKKHGFSPKIKRWMVWCLLTMCVIMIVSSKYLLTPIVKQMDMNDQVAWRLFYYSSPLTLLLSVCVFYIFIEHTWKNTFIKKTVTWISSVSLGIYIIHAHPYSLDYILTGENLAFVVKKGPFATLLISIAVILGITLLTAVFEQCRIMLFKLIGINTWIRRIGESLDEKMKIEIE